MIAPLRTVRYASASAIAVLALSTAVVGASSASIGTTGPNSTNKVKSYNSAKVHLTNNNSVSASNTNPQTSKSGDAKVHNNTTGGGATSGAAANDATVNAAFAVDNSGGIGGGLGMSAPDDTGTIDNTGPNSKNSIEFTNKMDVKVTNNNNLSFSNNNTQSATSGKAEVSNNTTGGDATSGDASNTSNTTITFDVTN